MSKGRRQSYSLNLVFLVFWHHDKKMHSAKTGLFSCADDVAHNVKANVFKLTKKI